MTPWVADYTRRIAPSALKAAGVVGVCRYLAASTGIGKIIAKAEYRELVGAGLEVVLNWEQSAQDWLGGAAAGKAHGTKAATMAWALGYPAGRPIPGSADFDMTAAQWSSSGRAYAVAYRDALHAGGYAAGVYGPWDVLSWCRDLGGFVMFWQSMSTGFSGKRNANPWPGGHLLQHFGAVAVGGQEVDRNDIRRPDWAGPTVEDDMPLTDTEHSWLAATTNRTNALASDDNPALPGYPSPGSPLGQILAAAKRINAGQVGGAGPTDAQMAAQAKAIGDVLVASNANGLTQADHAGVVQDVLTALREGTGSTTSGAGSE